MSKDFIKKTKKRSKKKSREIYQDLSAEKKTESNNMAVNAITISQKMKRKV